MNELGGRPAVRAGSGPWLGTVPAACDPDLARRRNAFDDVLADRMSEALLEYQWSADTEWRWAQVRRRRMAPGIPRVVVAHLDITARKRMPDHTTKKDGLGVGLSISRSIVRSHGGSIEVTNLPQGGARFAVHFPVG